MLKSLLFKVALFGLGVICCGSLNAQTFANIPALSFTMPFGGANPLPQTLTVSSTGAGFNYSVAATTVSGGNWLQTSPSGNDCCTAPSAVTVSVAPSSPLAVGTYTGSIVLTKYSGTSGTLNVPVTLTVSAASVAFFDNLPGQVSFSMLTGGNAPPAQFIQVRNAGVSTLNWSLSLSTADGGNWLSASAVSGAAPSTLSVRLTPSALPGAGSLPGTYIGQLVFKTTGSSITIPVSVTVGANIFAQVNALNFTKSYGGNNPLPQTVSISPTGTSAYFNVVAYNSAGGNWLSVSPSGNECCITPESITVSVNPSVSLAAGTYTAEVVVTQYAGHSMAMTVPVTLTIENANTQTFFDNMPGQVSFSLITSGSAPPSQMVQVRKAGQGTLSWTLIGTTADGGSWLTTSASSGVAPSMVTIGINPAKLPNGGAVPGTFVGQLVFQTAGDVVTVPVTVTVGADVFEQVNPITFTKLFGGANPLPQTLTVASTGAGFYFDIAGYSATGGNWLTVSPSGNECCITPESVTVSVNPDASLAAGTYTGQVVITQYSGHGMSLTVPVMLIVESPGAYFDNLPGQMSFSFATGGNTPPNQSLQIRNAGTGILNWTGSASTSDGGAWLSLSASSGSAPSAVSVGINKSALPGGGLLPGTFTGELVFQTAGDTATIPISVTVGANVFEQVNGINFTKPYAGANPLPQTLTIASTGSNFYFDVSASNANGGSWLVVSPSGRECCTTPGSITVSVNPAVNLPAGTYTGQVVVTQYSGNDMSMTIPVTLTVSAATSAFFDNLPGQVSFSMQTNGKTPPSQPLQIRNAGTGALNWTATESTSDGGKWLSISAGSGSAPSTTSVSINPALLPGGGQVAGLFTGQLVFQTAGDTTTVPVSVNVGSDVFLQVNALNFTKPYAGANPLPQSIIVASTGASFYIDAQASTANGGNWLTVTPTGNECCTTPTAFTIGVNAASTLAAGTYTGQVVFTQYSGNAMSMTVPVTLTVAPSTTAFFDNVQGQLSFSNVTGSANLASHSIQIRNAGTGSLTWNLTTSTADGGKWLTVSQSSGTAPSAVTIGVNNANLPGGGLVAGTFVGQVLLQSASSTVTIPVSVIIGSNVFQQLDTVTFSKSPGGTNPAAQLVTISSLGTNFYISAFAYAGNGGNWLTVNPSGNECCTTPAKLTVGVNSSAPATAGFYTGEIVLTQYRGGMSMTIPVYLAVGTSPLKPTTTVVTSSANPSSYGQPVTFTASISGGSGLTGTVTFYDGGASIGTGSVSGTTATLTTSSLGSGVHSISAVYGGNSVFSESVSPAISQTVSTIGAVTTTALTSSINPSLTGATVKFVATVTSSLSGITGSVTFKDGTTTLATVALASGSASYSTSSLAAGTHSNTAVYGGSSTLAPSTSPPLSQRVLLPTTTTVSSSSNPATSGQFITLTATVSGAAAGQNGYVTFLDGGVPLSTVPLNGTVAVLSLSSLAKGTHVITALYGGDTVYGGSISPAGSQVVQ